MWTPRRSPSPRKRSLSAATDSPAREMSATMTIANLPCTTVWLMSMMLQRASARICETAATMPGWSVPKTDTIRRSARPTQLVRRLDEFVGARDLLLHVHAVYDADDRRLDGHLLVADGRARGLPVRAHHDLAHARAQAVGHDDDVFGRLLVQVNRVHDQKSDALQVGRLLR